MPSLEFYRRNWRENPTPNWISDKEWTSTIEAQKKSSNLNRTTLERYANAKNKLKDIVVNAINLLVQATVVE